VKSIYQDKLGDQNRGALVMNSLPGVVTQVSHLKHSTIGIAGSMRQDPFEIGEERRVVKCPF
jgi:hypothetical protein